MEDQEDANQLEWKGFYYPKGLFDVWANQMGHFKYQINPHLPSSQCSDPRKCNDICPWQVQVLTPSLLALLLPTLLPSINFKTIIFLKME